MSRIGIDDAIWKNQLAKQRKDAELMKQMEEDTALKLIQEHHRQRQMEMKHKEDNVNHYKVLKDRLKKRSTIRNGVKLD